MKRGRQSSLPPPQLQGFDPLPTQNVHFGKILRYAFLGDGKAPSASIYTTLEGGECAKKTPF